MGVDFHALSYFGYQIDKLTALNYTIKEFQRLGFNYKIGVDCAETLELQIEKIKSGQDDSVWMQNEDLYDAHLAISDIDANLQELYISFIDDYIITDPPEIGRAYLEKLVELLINFHIFTQAEISWGGFAEDWLIDAELIKQNKVAALYWFNIYCPRLVEGIGREKLLNAPGWQIKELSEGSVVVRLSEHPHIYEKIGEVYLHEYLGFEYIS
jgi:hypothetical protein